MRDVLDDKDFDLDASEYYAFVVMRPKNRKSLTLRFPAKLVHGSAILGICLVIGLLGYSYYAKHFSVAQSQYNTLKASVESQDKQIEVFEDDLKDIEDKLIELKERELQIEHLFNPKAKAHSKRRIQNLIAAERKKFDKYKKEGALDSLSGLSKYQKSLAATLETLKTTIDEQWRTTEIYQARFAQTPSIWPVLGRIRSGFGWRTHPIHRKKQFHKGIDIPAWRGAPVKSTADGVIEYTGWGGGYGWLVIVWHDYGYQTIYAHLSEVLVTNGQQVKKGEVIAKVGSSGLSTGPHLHYEIRRWRKAVATDQYLGLNLFTAAKRIW